MIINDNPFKKIHKEKPDIDMSLFKRGMYVKLNNKLSYTEQRLSCNKKMLSMAGNSYKISYILKWYGCVSIKGYDFDVRDLTIITPKEKDKSSYQFDISLLEM